MEKLTLTQFQQQSILSVCPKGSRIICATYFRDEYLPCPIRVVVETPFQEKRTLVLRLVRHPDASLEKEVANVYKNKRRLDEAIIAYEKALSLDANLSEARRNLRLVKRLRELKGGASETQTEK